MGLRPEIARCTLKVKINQPVSNRSELLKLLNDNFEELSIYTSITAVYKCSDYSRDWYITFKSADTVDVFCTSEGRKDTRGGFEFVFDRLDRRTVHIRVHWFPMHYSSDPVKTYLERFGTVRKFDYDTQLLENGVNIQTGVICAEILSTESQYQQIPYTFSIEGKKVLVTVLGRPSMCLKCNQIGHSRAKCPRKVSEGRGRTYADAAANNTDPPAGQVRQEAMEASIGQVRQSATEVGSAGQVRQNLTIADSLAGQVRQENSATGDEWNTVHQRRKRKGSSPEEELDVKDSRVVYFLGDPPDM